MAKELRLLKIGEFARLAETNLRTLRYYEEIGLLLPARRSRGGFRYYRDTDINRVNMIRDLQDLGLNLERIRELMSVRQEGSGRGEFLASVTRALNEHGRLLDERVKALEQQRQRVDVALSKIQDCGLCVHHPQPGNNRCEPCVCTGERLPELLSALY